MAADPRVNERFKGMKPPRLEKFKSKLGRSDLRRHRRARARTCGKDMKTTHQGMKITEAEWNATVENLVKALDTKQGRCRSRKGELLAALGPMKKDIVGQ